MIHMQLKFMYCDSQHYFFIHKICTKAKNKKVFTAHYRILLQKIMTFSSGAYVGFSSKLTTWPPLFEPVVAAVAYWDRSGFSHEPRKLRRGCC